MIKKPKRKLSALLEDPQVQSWRTMMGAFQGIFQQLESGLNQENCSISRFQILFNLYFDGDLSASEIARRLFVTRGNISMFLKRLLLEKLIAVSKESPSSKRPLYCLTSIGGAFFEEIFPRHVDRVKILVPVFKKEILKELK